MRRINFTGSTATGRRLAEAAGRNLKRVVLELGGHNPLMVLADADLDYAVNAAAFGAFLHQGQICMSSRRILVERPVADAFTERPRREDGRASRSATRREPDTVIGPLINADALATVRGRVDDAVARGRAGAGRRPGGRARASRRRCSRTCRRTAELARMETFGPVAAIEVVDERRRRPSSAPTRRLRPVCRASSRATRTVAWRSPSGSRPGIVHVNDQTVDDEPQMPFGGVKDSGWGRFGGRAAMDEFTELRWVTVQSGTRPFPF